MNRYIKLSIVCAALVFVSFVAIPINLSNIYGLVGDTAFSDPELSAKINRAELTNTIIFSSIVLFSIAGAGFAIYGYTKKRK